MSHQSTHLTMYFFSNMFYQAGLNAIAVSVAPVSVVVAFVVAIPPTRYKSLPAHRHQRAKRAAVRKSLKGLQHKVRPVDWWVQTKDFRAHHSHPYQQLEQIFYDFTSGSSGFTGMPQKWQCKCGNGIPMSQAFCGFCGTRWDKVNRQGKQQNTPKPKPATASAQPEPRGFLQEFALPEIGFSSSQSSQPGTSVGGQSKGTPPVVKSIKTQLHQRANRIGKVEQRISKLQDGLATVAQEWPLHVQEIQHSLQSDLEKCKEFQDRASQELTSLQTELQGLLHQSLEPDRPVEHAAPPVLPISEPNPGHIAPSLLPQVYAAISQLQAQGLIQVNFPQVGPVPMDCTEQRTPFVQSPVDSFPAQVVTPSPVQHPVGLASMHPSVGAHLPYQVAPPQGFVQPSPVHLTANGLTKPATHVPQQVQLPVRDTAVEQPSPPSFGAMTPQARQHVPPEPMTPPPGNWNSPGAYAPQTEPLPMPNAPWQEGQAVQDNMFPNPLYKPKTPVQQPVQTQVAQQTDVANSHAMDQAVADATTAMMQFYAVPSHADLPPQVQQQLSNFAAQQEYCRQQIA